MLPDKQPNPLHGVPAWALGFAYIVGNVGFPIAVAAWLLYRIDPVLRNQTQLLERILWLLERGGLM